MSPTKLTTTIENYMWTTTEVGRPSRMWTERSFAHM